MENEEVFDDLEEIAFSEFSELDFTTIDEKVTYNIFEDNFPECLITRLEDKLQIRIEEHIYTKYWFHKYHAFVFAEAMIKAIKRLSQTVLSFKRSNEREALLRDFCSPKRSTWPSTA